MLTIFRNKEGLMDKSVYPARAQMNRFAGKRTSRPKRMGDTYVYRRLRSSAAEHASHLIV